MLHVVWFKRDLRLYDHAPLQEAVQSGEPILPIYVAEPSIWQGQELSARHYQFVKESLADLQVSLQKKGGELYVAVGEMEEVLSSIYEKYGAFTLHAHEENGTPHTFDRDKRVHRWMKEKGLLFKEKQHFGVVRRLKSRDDFAEHWENFIRQPLIPVAEDIPCVEEVPSLLTPNFEKLEEFYVGGTRLDRGQTGGERHAHRTFSEFLDRRFESYNFHISKPLASSVSCSRLSPYLAWGNISIRYVTQKTEEKMRECSPKERKHLQGFMSRIHWHCHFIQRIEDDPDISRQTLNPAFDEVRKEWDEQAFRRWYEGKTGIPMIDASMRALHETGWINFRSRAMVVSFICNTLMLDWRKPADALAGLFLDYEPGIHYSQMQMQSGSTGFNTIRIYNPIKQGIEHDPDGAFIRKFIPELRDVPPLFIHEPWKLSDFDALSYPEPIVDVPSANKRARDILWAVKGSKKAKASAEKQLEKHGSRKWKPKKKPEPEEGEQLTLNLF
ncbi:deoxyribodipyrimidine photo-lyase [Halobacillus fulvus]|nr:deoxyribodipyrimidine photo-lyase [Halobacillus fulvus]